MAEGVSIGAEGSGTEVSGAELNSGLYLGEVWHQRKQPKANEFNYQVYMVYLDLDEIDQVFSQSRLWGTQRQGFRPIQFKRKDFFKDFDKPLALAIRDWVEQQTGIRPTGPIRMLANLRCWGFLINPIVCYYLFDESGKNLQHIIAEVTNTPWRERTQYLLYPNGNNDFDSVEFDKTLFVSPFYDLNMHYRWRSNTPGEELRINIENRCEGSTVFKAGLALQKQALTPAAQRSVLWRHPWMTAKVGLSIYWQALKLLLKRVPLVPHPKKYARNG